MNVLIKFFLAGLASGAASNAGAQSLDAFNPQPQAAPDTLAIQADGKILMGGPWPVPVPAADGMWYGSQRLRDCLYSQHAC